MKIFLIEATGLCENFGLFSYFLEAQPLFLLNTYGIPYFIAVSKYYVLV